MSGPERRASAEVPAGETSTRPHPPRAQAAELARVDVLTPRVPIPRDQYLELAKAATAQAHTSLTAAGAFEGDAAWTKTAWTAWTKTAEMVGVMGHTEYAIKSALRDYAAWRLPLRPGPCVVGVFTAEFGAPGRRRRAEIGRAFWQGGGTGPPAVVALGPPQPRARGELHAAAVSAAQLESAAAAAAELDEAATAAVARRELVLEARFYPPGAPGAPGAAREADARRLAPKIFAAALSEPFTARERAAGAAARGEPEFAELAAWLDAAAPGAAARARRAVFVAPGGLAPSAESAVWLAPLHVRELSSPGDVTLPLWCDIAVAQGAADLAANSVCGAYARYAPAATAAAPPGGDSLAGGRAGRERAARSEAVAATLDSLGDSRERLARECAARPGDAALGDAAAALAAVADFAAARLVESGTYLAAPAAAHLSLADFAAGLAAAALAPADPADVPPCVALPDVCATFATPGDAARALFEFAYAADCLHARLGVAHGSLGPESLGFFCGASTHYLTFERGGPVAVANWADPKVVYVLGARGAADSFSFRAAFLMGGVCDTGGALVGPGFRARLEARAPAETVTALYRDQVGRALRVLARCAPALVEAHGAELAALGAARWDALFPAVCAADFAAIGAAAGAALAQLAGAAGPAGPLACPEALELAGALQRAGAEAVAAELERLLRDGAAPPGAAPAWPGPPILRRVFAAWAWDGAAAPPPALTGWPGHCGRVVPPSVRPGARVMGVFAREAPLAFRAADAPWLRGARPGEFEAPG